MPRTPGYEVSVNTTVFTQMLVCSQDPLEVPEEKLEELPLTKRKELNRKFSWNHGSMCALNS